MVGTGDGNRGDKKTRSHGHRSVSDTLKHEVVRRDTRGGKKKGGKKKCSLENRWYLFITKKVSVL